MTGELDKSSVLAGASYDPFDEDVPDEVLKLRKIAATKMTESAETGLPADRPGRILQDRGGEDHGSECEGGQGPL